MSAVDLFAGPGGWDEGIRDLGIRPLGIEYDDAACATREAAGHRTVQADIAELDPLNFAPCELLIGSPPCQAFSAAGKGDGHRDVPLILEAATALVNGHDTRAEVNARCRDPRSALVLEPLRWALALRPAYVALEQVPPVLELWQVFADLLRWRGYRVWTGILSTEQYGVPQTRRRAFLLASTSGHVAPPRATHQAYTPGEPAAEQWTLEGVLQPWVSMAEALGWGATQRPVPTVTGGGKEGVGSPAPIARGGRESLDDEIAAGRWTEREEQLAEDTVTAWLLKPTALRATNERPNAATRDVATPAPTMAFEHNPPRWLVDPLELKGEDWPERRPATTIAGDPRVFQPGGHHREGEQSQDAIRVTLEEAAVLQGFPPGYPFQGSRTKQFQQVGNAVPPPLARAVILALVGEALEQRRAA